VATPADRVWHEYSDLVHELEIAYLLGRGALHTSIFDPRFNGLLSNIAHKDAPLIVLKVPIYGAGLSRLGRRGRATAGDPRIINFWNCCSAEWRRYLGASD
jgi:hypothetical protein